MRERDGAHRLGPQAWRAYTALRERIRSGELPRGTKLLPQVELASTLGVSLLTLRQALSQLENEGLIVSEHGRGTFIRANAPTVILLEDDELQQVVLATYVEQDGYKVLPASDPDQALLLVAETPNVTLVLCDIRVPSPEQGLGFVRAVRRRWPRLPLVAVTGHPEDLTPLCGSPDHPVLILTKPVVAAQIREVLRYVTASHYAVYSLA